MLLMCCRGLTALWHSSCAAMPCSLLGRSRKSECVQAQSVVSMGRVWERCTGSQKSSMQRRARRLGIHIVHQPAQAWGFVHNRLGISLHILHVR